jgi:hypothetical protein
VNKLLAILFAMGAIGGFGLSQRDSFQSQNVNRYGAPADEVRTVSISHSERVGYIAFGAICAAACLFFIVRVRRDDLRR